MSLLIAQKETMDLVSFVETLISTTGLEEQYVKEDTDESRARIENIREFLGSVHEFAEMADDPTVESYLENIALVTDLDRTDDDNGFVTLMTLHSAKGLEFEVVFLPGWEEGLFPHQRALDEGAESLEEERRLAYVAITRAKHRLFISMAFNRKMYAEWKNNLPSRFIDELPSEHIELINKCSYFSANRSTFNPNYNRRNYNNDDYEESYSDGSTRYSYTRPKYQNNNLGKKVRHETFGDGTIVAQDGNAVQVCFENGGIKKIMASYLKIVG